MALNAEIRDRWERNKIPISRSMRYVAAQALHGDVLISGVDHLLPHGVVRMLRPIVATLAEFDHRRLFKKENTVRRVGGMAGIATSLLDRIVCHGTLDHFPFCRSIFLFLFFGKLFLLHQGVDVALPTQALHITHQKLLLR